MTDRNGWGTGLMMLRSGQVPTTTCEPFSRSARTASPTRRADGPIALRDVMSLPPTRITEMSGSPCAICIASICPGSPLEVAPTIALMLSRTSQPDSSARPRASRTPGNSSGESAPRPAASESPKIIMCTSHVIPGRHGSGDRAPGR
jgi:hypothetical protein